MLSGQGARGFRGGFLGVESFGRSTLVPNRRASEQDRAKVIERSRTAGRAFGAPNLAAARIARRGSGFRRFALRPPKDTLSPVIARMRTEACAKPSARCIRARGP